MKPSLDATELERQLRTRVKAAQHGDRLPPVRALMREFGVGQAVMQEALARIARQGLLSLQVGRGTFVQKPGQQRPAGLEGASVLVLSMRGQTERSHDVARLLHKRLSEQGARCVQLVYERIDEAQEVLRFNTRFDICVLQSYFDIVPLALLSFLRARCGALVVDGARLAGIDADAIASDWRDAMDIGLDSLRASGHERVAFLAWPGSVQPLDGLRRHWVSLRMSLRSDAARMPLLTLERMPAPDESSADLIRASLAGLWARRGPHTPTALMIWVGPHGRGLVQALQSLRVKAPRDLSVVVLGHINREEEHQQRFDIVGSNSSQAAEALALRVQQRIAEPLQEHQTVYLENRLIAHGSVAVAA